VYDKGEEQRKQKKKTAVALTRVEIVYKPEEKIPIDSFVQFLLKSEKRAMALAV
jgi:hypothetical protein